MRRLRSWPMEHCIRCIDGRMRWPPTPLRPGSVTCGWIGGLQADRCHRPSSSCKCSCCSDRGRRMAFTPCAFTLAARAALHPARAPSHAATARPPLQQRRSPSAAAIRRRRTARNWLTGGGRDCAVTGPRVSRRRWRAVRRCRCAGAAAAAGCRGAHRAASRVACLPPIRSAPVPQSPLTDLLAQPQTDAYIFGTGERLGAAAGPPYVFQRRPKCRYHEPFSLSRLAVLVASYHFAQATSAAATASVRFAPLRIHRGPTAPRIRMGRRRFGRGGRIWIDRADPVLDDCDATMVDVEADAAASHPTPSIVAATASASRMPAATAVAASTISRTGSAVDAGATTAAATMVPASAIATAAAMSVAAVSAR